MKTSELQGAALDWAVARCEGKDGDCEVHAGNVWYGRVTSGFVQYHPSTNWAQGGPIIEREKIALRNWLETGWQADKWNFKFDERHATGPTLLIAAMRCFVSSRLGDEVDIPGELE